MSGREKKRDVVETRGSAREQTMDELEVTAQPTGLTEELSNRIKTHDSGLSVDPDELGQRFLTEATEQGNFESEYDDSLDLSVSDAARTDDALPGPNFEATSTVWENTVNLTLQGADQAHGPLVDDRSDGMRLVESDDEQTESEDLDLTENAVQDASLLDSESDQYGETRSPDLRTEDSGSHGKRRGGGHAPGSHRTVSTPRDR